MARRLPRSATSPTRRAKPVPASARIWRWDRPAITGPSDLVGFWVEEKQYFQPGTFPNVSRTGQWKDVAHYTQMIWKGTTNVGCAVHVAGGPQLSDLPLFAARQRRRPLGPLIIW